MSTPLVSAAYCLHPGCAWTAGPSTADDPTGTRDIETRARRHHGEITGGTTPGHPITITTWPTAGRDPDRAHHQRWTHQTQRTLTRWTPPAPPQPSSEPTPDAP